MYISYTAHCHVILNLNVKFSENVLNGLSYKEDTFIILLFAMFK